MARKAINWLLWGVSAAALLCAVSRPAIAQGFEARLASPDVKIYPDSPPPTQVRAPIELLAAANEYAPFQGAITALEDLAGVFVSIETFMDENGNKVPGLKTETLKVANVTVERSTLNVDPSEWGDFRKVWPDPLPRFRPFELKKGETAAVWFDLKVPADAKPGLYSGKATFGADGHGIVSLQVWLRVANVVLPEARTLKTAFGISYDQIAAAHHIENESPQARTLDDAYYWFLVDHRLTPYYIPVDFFSEDAHKYLDDPRVNFLRAPFSWDEAEMRRIADRLKETGWIDKAVYYQVDEPETKEFPKINKIGQWLHSFDPKIHMLLTHGHSPQLDPAGIDIWVPNLINAVAPSEMQRLKKELKKGKQLWWYTCIGPKWAGMNYFIDEPAPAPHLHPWMNWLYGVTGILYWQTTNWKRVDYNPWEKTETYPAGNGDGQLLYPGYQVNYDGPVASMRLKLLREGIEDYELVNLLGEKLAEAAAKIGAAAADYDPKERQFELAFALVDDEGRSSPLGNNAPWISMPTKDPLAIERQRALLINELETALQPPLALAESSPKDNGYASKGQATIKGYMEEGAEVLVNGLPAETKGARFRATVTLKEGRNDVKITVRKDGREKILRRTFYKKPAGK